MAIPGWLATTALQHILAAFDTDLRVIDLNDVDQRAKVGLPEWRRSVVRLSRIVRPKLSIRAGLMRISDPLRDFVASRAARARSRSDHRERFTLARSMS